MRPGSLESDAEKHMHMPAGTLSVSLDLLLPLRDRLTQLRFGGLHSGGSADDRWSTDQLTAIRRFTHLTELDLARTRPMGITARELYDLFGSPSPVSPSSSSSPPPLPLRHLHLTTTIIDQESADALAQAGNITTFRPYGISLRDAEFIAACTRLESCTLRCEETVDADLLIAALAQCTRIKDLRLSRP